MPVEAYQVERIAELGEFVGTVVAGIYAGIRDGALDNSSDYAAASGRAHVSWADYSDALR